jgi:hypothetical protein
MACHGQVCFAHYTFISDFLKAMPSLHVDCQHTDTCLTFNESILFAFNEWLDPRDNVHCLSSLTESLCFKFNDSTKIYIEVYLNVVDLLATEHGILDLKFRSLKHLEKIYLTSG